MRLRTKVFILSASMALAAMAGMLGTSLASGRASIVRASLESLEREAGRTTAILDGTLRSMRDLGESFVSLRSFLASQGQDIFHSTADLELCLPGGEILLARGIFAAGDAPKDRPEWYAAQSQGASYVLRRAAGKLRLFYSAPALIQGADLVISLAASMDSLDLYERSQLTLLGVSGALAAILLLGASYALSRTVTRRLEELVRRAAAVASGDYAARAAEGGRDEIASLAASFNAMAASIEREIARLEAEKADRQAFIDDLTHELRTPVTSIVGFAELLRSRSWDDKAFGEGLERIGAEGRRILELTEGLKRLLLARSAAHSFEPADAAALVLAAVSEKGPAAQKAGIALEAAVGSGSIRCDPGLISVVLGNLIDNSLRASAPGSRVIVGFRAEGGGGRLFVRDFGRGMDDEELARACTPFRRGSGGGFGLGLAICDEIAKSHGARLRIERPEGGGLEVSMAFENLQRVYGADASA